MTASGDPVGEEQSSSLPRPFTLGKHMRRIPIPGPDRPSAEVDPMSLCCARPNRTPTMDDSAIIEMAKVASVVYRAAEDREGDSEHTH